jgi:hypothetical protein
MEGMPAVFLEGMASGENFGNSGDKSTKNLSNYQ